MVKTLCNSNSKCSKKYHTPLSCNSALFFLFCYQIFKEQRCFVRRIEIAKRIILYNTLAPFPCRLFVNIWQFDSNSTSKTCDTSNNSKHVLLKVITIIIENRQYNRGVCQIWKTFIPNSPLIFPWHFPNFPLLQYKVRVARSTKQSKCRQPLRPETNRNYRIFSESQIILRIAIYPVRTMSDVSIFLVGFISFTDDNLWKISDDR